MILLVCFNISKYLQKIIERKYFEVLKLLLLRTFLVDKKCGYKIRAPPFVSNFTGKKFETKESHRMFDRKSDYALNKKDPGAIVFKTAAGAYVRLRQEDFSSEEEFHKWKVWSDEDYHIADIGNHTYAKHTTSLDGAAAQAASPSPEQLLSEWYDQLDREQFCKLLSEGIDTCLTEPQRRRLLKYYFEDKTQEEIADSEGVAYQNIAESLWRAKEKLKKFFKKAMH
ncbi:hypothetical protein D5272_03850 [bacterium D16-76]|nr:hypothetical protein [bacterium D16-76]